MFFNIDFVELETALNFNIVNSMARKYSGIRTASSLLEKPRAMNSIVSSQYFLRVYFVFGFVLHVYSLLN